MIRRAGAALAVAGATLALAWVLAGCGGVAAPTGVEGAARLVPADALAYVHVELRGDAAAAVAQSAATLPGYRRLLRGVEARLATVTGVPFARVAPWLGAEAAVAIVPEPGSGSASQEIVLGVRDRAGARRFLTASRAPATRLIGDFVVIGLPETVAAAVRAAADGGRRSLARRPAFRRAAAADPGVLSAYATGAGLAEVLGGRPGLGGVLATALGGARTVAAGLTGTGDGFRVGVTLFGRPVRRRFTPTLMSALPASTDWAIDLPSLTGSMPGVLAALAGGRSGGGLVGGLVSRLGSALAAQGVQAGPLAATFAGQAALFGVAGGVGLLAVTHDARAAGRELGLAGAALASLFAPAGAGTGAGAEPIVETFTVGGVPVTAYVQGSSRLELAIVDGRIAITTAPATMAALIHGGPGLASTDRYGSVLGGSGPAAGPVLFGVVNRLVSAASHAGLLESLGLAGLDRLLARISAAGLTSGGDPGHTTAELYITIP